MPMLAIAITSTTLPLLLALLIAEQYLLWVNNSTEGNETEQVSLHFFTCGKRAPNNSLVDQRQEALIITNYHVAWLQQRL
jgi:hypothetical protein